MIRLDYYPRSRRRRMRQEMAAMGDQLLAAAGQGAKQVGKRSRRTSKVARDRMTSAALALRGQHEPRWPWLATGLAAGFAAGLAIGAAGAVMTNRWRTYGQSPAQQAESVANALREKAGDAADTVRERANTAASRVRGAVNNSDSAVPTGATPVSEPPR